MSTTRYVKRAFSSGMQITIGNSAGVAAPFLYGAGDSPELLSWLWRYDWLASDGCLFLYHAALLVQEAECEEA